VKVVFTDTRAQLPKRAHADDAGYDVYAVEPVSIRPGDIGVVPLGFKAAIPSIVYGQLASRSSLAKLGVLVVGGVIDPGYRGEWKVMLLNLSGSIFHVAPGDAVAQVIFYPILRPKIDVTDELEYTTRGEGGFGSTNK
jgi:dUTP pyrophosphatase